MALSTKGIFIVGAKRTPFCSFGGNLREYPAGEAFAVAAKNLFQSANVDPSIVDQTVVGNTYFLSQCDGGKTARYCGIYSGVPIERPALGVSKACGSGMQAVVTSVIDIVTNEAKVTLTGGTEIMSSLPFLIRNTRFGTNLGAPCKFVDLLQKQLIDSYTGLTMHQLAEETAKNYNIDRREADKFAEQSRLKLKIAQKSNIFRSELTPMTVTLKKKNIEINEDQIVNADFTVSDQYQIPAVNDGSVVTERNSSTPADGATALLLASEDAANKYNLIPLVNVAAWATVGVEPKETMLGAVHAIRKLVDVAKINLDTVDLFELNENFATQTLATIKELRIDYNKVNVNGGALALGNPVAATGARIIAHLAYELRRRNLKCAIAASSCGGGQGIAILLENV